MLPALGGEHFEFPEPTHGEEWFLVLSSIAVAAFGIYQAGRYYLGDPAFTKAKNWATKLAPIHRLLENKYYVDELYNATAIGGTLMFARALSWFDKSDHRRPGQSRPPHHRLAAGEGSSLFDKYVVDGLVNGVAWTAGRARWRCAARRAGSCRTTRW